MRTCQWILFNGSEFSDSPDYCGKPCEGKNVLCATHSRLARKEVEQAEKATEKRNTLIAKQREKNKTPRAKISKVSPKRKEENKEYSSLASKFKAEHPNCEINANEYCTGKTDDIHHPAGRIGSLLLDVSKWKAACRSCHQYAHDHPKEAIEKGWSESRLATTEPHKI